MTPHLFSSAEQLIGHTPLLRLRKIEEHFSLCAQVLAKLENFNLTGSVKDRVAKAILDDAEQKGLIRPGSTVIEATSGNTGIGLAAVGTMRGYRVIIVMPDSMSKERIRLIEAYGAEVVLTDGKQGMKGSIQKAEELSLAIEQSFMPRQFENPANPDIHFETTGPEIWQATGGAVDVLVAGVGTGGTISGVGEYLKAQNPKIHIVAIEPANSPVLSKGEAGRHDIQGIGAGFVPNTLNQSVYDEIMTVHEEDAKTAMRMVAKLEGVLVGISSGAALEVAITLAKREEWRGKNIVVLFPDTGMRYLSSDLF